MNDMPNLTENQYAKLYRENGTFIVVAEHNQMLGVCDCCQGFSENDFVKFEIFTVE